MLYPNITRNFEESWEFFSYVDNVKTWGYFQQQLIHVAGSIAMLGANSKIKKKYGIVDERKELTETMNVWTRALKGQKFLHGDKPTMPDVMVFGVLKAIKGLRTFNAENAELKTWYDNVEAAIPAGKN
jgi:glutathione S-transferase